MTEPECEPVFIEPDSTENAAFAMLYQAHKRKRNAEYKQRYREKHPAYVARETQNRGTRRESKREAKPFVSVDGEGAPGRDPSARSYVLLSAGTDYIESAPGKNLTWHECLNWLCHLPEDSEYVSFAFDYDVAAMLCQYTAYDRGWKTLERLIKTGQAVFYTDLNTGWMVSYRPKMELKITPLQRCSARPSGWCGSHPCKNCGKSLPLSRGHTIRISDTIKLFQTTLVNAITKWKTGTSDERALIVAGKDNRERIAYNDPAERAEVLSYNQLEVRLHAEIMERFRAAWLRAGLPLPRSWNSPGQLAKTVFSKYKVPARKELDALGNTPKPVWNAASHAYYGGWFEVSLFGPVPGMLSGTPLAMWCQMNRIPGQRPGRGEPLVTEYDLTSAYPWAMTHLPCLRHSHWEHREPGNDEYGLIAVTAQYKTRDPSGWLSDELPQRGGFPMFMGLPHRDRHMRVSRPLRVSGWYWNFEVAQARHQTVTVHDGWTWVSDGCDCHPWDFVPELFALRKELDHEDKGTGTPVKLTINSFYGITAQRKRGDDSHPPYLNHVVASFITAWTRTRLMRTIHEQSCEHGLPCGINVVMIATDAIFFLGDPHLPAWDDETEKDKASLGDWTRKPYPRGIFIVQGGLYWEIGKEDTHSKTRGVPAAVIRAHIADFQRAYERMAETGKPAEVTLTHKRLDDGTLVRCQRHVGLVEGIHRRDRHHMGTFTDLTRKLGFDWSSKREFWQILTPVDPLWTRPKIVDDPVSVPYEPEQFYGLWIPPYLGEDARIDILCTDPDWQHDDETLSDAE